MFFSQTGDFMNKRNRIKKIISALLLMLIISSLVTLNVSATSDFEITDGILTSYKGKSKNVTIPDDVYYIADSAFAGNTSVQSVALSNVTAIGNYAFSNCTALKTVTGYDGLVSCGGYAFFGTPFLNNRTEQDLVMGSVLVDTNAKDNYTVPSSVTSIAPYACVNNEAITSLTIGDNVLSVGEGAFWNCTGLKTVSVSGNVSYIGGYAFVGTKYLDSLKDEFVILGNGILVDANTTTADVVIPSTVKQIGAAAFESCKTLKSVVINTKVTAIGKRAFYNCTALQTADIPDSIVSIEDEAFYNCTALKSVLIPETVKFLGESVFLGCSVLKTAQVNINIPLSAGLFADCPKLEYVYISSNPVAVENYAFYGCSKLKGITLPDSVAFIADNAFSGCSKLSVWCNSDSYSADALKKQGVTVCQTGDANEDGKVNVRDATQIQKAVAGLVTLEFSANMKADADFNGEINVRDATRVQKNLAGLD